MRLYDTSSWQTYSDSTSELGFGPQANCKLYSNLYRICSKLLVVCNDPIQHDQQLRILATPILHGNTVTDIPGKGYMFLSRMSTDNEGEMITHVLENQIELVILIRLHLQEKASWHLYSMHFTGVALLRWCPGN